MGSINLVVGKKASNILSDPRMTERALELLLLPDRPCLLLDIGCGSGISALVAFPAFVSLLFLLVGLVMSLKIESTAHENA